MKNEKKLKMQKTEILFGRGFLAGQTKSGDELKVRELLFLLGELELLGKGDDEVEMSCEGFAFDVEDVYISSYGSVFLGDGEAENNINLERVTSHNVHEVIVYKNGQNERAKEVDYSLGGESS
jgi:hypothetical protein